MSFRASCIICILVMKYSANSSASTSGELHSGSGFFFLPAHYVIDEFV